MAATSDIVIQLDDGSKGNAGGWLDTITDFHFPSGDVLALDVSLSAVTPTGTAFPAAPLSGLPFPIPDIGTSLALRDPAATPPTPPVVDPQTSAMLSFYDAWSVPKHLTVTSTFKSNSIIIPIKRLKTPNKTSFSLSLAVPGYGNKFVITHKQTVYVPWDLMKGIAFPGGDTDQFGNIWPIRAHGANANANGTLIIAGGPDQSLTFLPDSGWGAWSTAAAGSQQCNALNTLFGAANVNFTSIAWDFWFTQYCGSTGLVNAQTFKGKDIKDIPYDTWSSSGKQIGSASTIFSTGHGSRTSSWGFTDSGTAHLGASGVITITGDTKTLILKGSTVPP